MTTTSSLRCPRCSKNLQLTIIPGPKEKTEVDQCPECRGIWFDEGELQRMDQLVKPVLVEFRQIPDEYDQLTPLNCPKCTDHPRMEKHEHQRDEQVIIDVCPTCQGIWLDGGELEAIQQDSLLKLLLG